MKNLKPKEIAAVVFAAVGIFGAQIVSFLDYFIYTKTSAIVIIVLWSLYYVLFIITLIKNSQRKFAVFVTICYVILLFSLVYNLLLPRL